MKCTIFQKRDTLESRFSQRQFLNHQSGDATANLKFPVKFVDFFFRLSKSNIFIFSANRKVYFNSGRLFKISCNTREQNIAKYYFCNTYMQNPRFPTVYRHRKWLILHCARWQWAKSLISMAKTLSPVSKMVSTVTKTFLPPVASAI